MPTIVWDKTALPGLRQEDARICSDRWTMGLGAYSDGMRYGYYSVGQDCSTRVMDRWIQGYLQRARVRDLMRIQTGCALHTIAWDKTAVKSLGRDDSRICSNRQTM